MILAGFSGIEKSYPSKNVLKGVSGAIKEGERIAFLGSNGTGKTTLLEILAGKIDQDAGSLEIPKTIRRGYLPQDTHPDDNMTLFDFAQGGLESLLEMQDRQDEIHRLLEKKHNQEDHKTLLDELGKLQTRFEELGGYHIDTKTGEILRGLGFAPSDDLKKIRELSGGMQNRAALARLLIGEPDLLLLDEPTNHLDIAGLEFLEMFLNNFRGGVIYVSHDRAFIRNTATSIWELTAGRVMAYAGRYDDYLVEREKRIESLLKSYESQKEFIARTEEFIRRNIYGQKTRQAQSRRRMLAKLERLDKPSTAEDAASINFADGARSARIVVKCEKASFSYDKAPLLAGLDFVIERGERVGLFGPNGSGKTTVIKLLLGRLQPTTGSIECGRRLSIGYYDQLGDDIDPKSTPLAVIREIRPEWTEPQIRGYLAGFLFRGDDIFRTVGSFSGGEQSRLMLARIIVANPNFLVLDEPTNHLDIQSREALESALADYNGTILCVSHDRQFLDSFAEKIFAIENGSIKIYLGGYSDYKAKITPKEIESPARIPKPEKSYTKSARRGINPQIIKKAADKIESIEKTISDLETAIGELETSTDWQKIWTMMKERDDHYAELEKLYEEFDKLTAQDD